MYFRIKPAKYSFTYLYSGGIPAGACSFFWPSKNTIKPGVTIGGLCDHQAKIGHQSTLVRP
jgi:hypothetical protein